MHTPNATTHTPDFPRHGWISAGRCGPNGGNCVEVNDLGSGRPIGVRDSKNIDDGVLVFDAHRWRAFLSAARTGAFDLL